MEATEVEMEKAEKEVEANAENFGENELISRWRRSCHKNKQKKAMIFGEWSEKENMMNR